MIALFSELFVFNLHGVLNIVSAFINLTLGLVIYLNNPRSSLQRSYLQFALACSIWTACYGMMSLVRSDQNVGIWLSLAFIGVSFIPTALFSFSRKLLADTNTTKLTRIGTFLSAIFFLLMFLKQNEICEIRIFSWGRFNHFRSTPIGLVYFYLLMAFFVTYALLAYTNFIKGYKSATSPIQRKQFKSVLIAFSIGYLGMLDFGVTREWDIYPFGYLALTILVSVVAYSIIRYQLWDINLAIKRTSMIILIYTFLIGFSLPVLFPVANHALGNVMTENVALFLLFSAVFGFIFSTGPFIYAYLVRNTFWLKEHITTGLTHELKSPIGAIRGAIDLLIGKLDGDANKEATPYIEMIDKNTARLEVYVRDLLYIAKIQDGQLSVDKTAMDLTSVIRSQIKLNNGNIAQKELRILVDGPASLSILADKEKIEQAISNILSNAIKFSNNEGTIRISLAQINGAVRCVTADTGKGIAPADLERVFDRFYQGKNASKGSGIGLAIAKAWVEAHGGRIWAESEGAGRGTKVTFTLPVA